MKSSRLLVLMAVALLAGIVVPTLALIVVFTVFLRGGGV